jgi:hypothetical protein
MNKYNHSVSLMQACINVKNDTQACSHTLNQLMRYMMDNFTNPNTDKQTNSMVKATHDIIHAQYPRTKPQWLELLSKTPPAFKEPVFIIAVLTYLLARERINCCFHILDHDGTYTEFRNRYGNLIKLAV